MHLLTVRASLVHGIARAADKRQYAGVPHESVAGLRAAREGPWPPGGIPLLDADPDLGADLSAEELAHAQRQALLPAVFLERGTWHVSQLEEAPGVQGDVGGFLVLEGAVTIGLSIAGQVCTRVITPSEIILLDGWKDDSIPVKSGWSALEPATIAILDQRLTVIAARWPKLMTAILARAAEQLRHALLQQAISQLPRVEDRLLALLWSIADRRGVTRGAGVWVHLPVTHATLAEMIGARRPTVSLGLKALSDHGLLKPQDGGWLIARESLDAFPAPVAFDARPDIPKDPEPGT